MGNQEDGSLFVQALQIVEQQVREMSIGVIELLLDQCPRKTKDEPIEGKDKSHAASNIASAKMEIRWGSLKSDKNS